MPRRPRASMPVWFGHEADRATGEADEVLRHEPVEARSPSPAGQDGHTVPASAPSSRRRDGRRLAARGERGADGRADSPAQLDDGALAVRVDAIRQDDHVPAAYRIEPHRRPREAGMADGAVGEEGAERARVRRGHVPSEPARGLADDVRREHRAHRRLPSDSGGRRADLRPSSIRQNRARSSAVENSPAWPATPDRRRALPSCTTPRSGRTAVDRLRRRDARAPGGRRPERRRAHPERPVEPLLHVPVEGLPAHAADHLGEQDEPDVAVDEGRSGRGREPRLRLQGRRLRKPARHGLAARQIAASPEECVSRRRIVTSRNAGPANSLR